MSERTCPGQCCAVFPLGHTLEEIQADPSAILDGDFVADMLIPLTLQEAADRAMKFGAILTDIAERADSRGYVPASYFTCRHWDEDTRLCTVYDRRPHLCRDFPYEQACIHCGFCNPEEKVAEWEAIRERQRQRKESLVHPDAIEDVEFLPAEDDPPDSEDYGSPPPAAEVEVIESEPKHEVVANNPRAIELLLRLEREGLATRTALQLPADLTFDAYEAMCVYLGQIKGASSWWIGDALLFGDAKYGEKYAQAADATGLTPETLMNYASVAKRVARSRRRTELSFGHHAEIAALEPEQQEVWLQRAVEGGWSRSRLRLESGPSRALAPTTDDPEEVSFTSKGKALKHVCAQMWDVKEDDGDAYRIPKELIARMGALIGKGE